MFERFARSARAAVEDAHYEAARRGDRRIGTEHLLVALVADENIARAIGADPEAAREAADELDRSALRGIGIDLGAMRVVGRSPLGKRTPFTPAAKTVLQQTLRRATAEKARAITTRHLALALLDLVEPDPSATLLKALSVDAAAARDRLGTAS